MRILSRYVLREFLVPLFYCLAGFLGIYVLFELFDSFNRLMEARPPFLEVVAFFAGYVSPYLEWLFPAALLLGTLYTMWNFCRHSEITAMRANGIGFTAIVRPLLVVAALMALAVAAINEFYAPHAAEQARAMRENRFKPLTNTEILNIPYYNQQARRVWRINHMRSDQPNRIEGVRISFDRPDGSRQLDITCRSAEYLDGLWWLFYPQYQYFDELNNPIENPKPQLADLVIRAMPELNESPRDFLLMNKAWEFYSVRDMLHYLKNHPHLEKHEVASKTFDVHARLAAPFSCLIITLFAIPAGMASGRQSVFKGVLLAVALFFGFYVVTNGCMVLAKNGLMPVILGAWCANVIFLAAGLALFYRQR
ncbi:MAG TPA: LptF/LptG family permease [Kiritimatiellia bacterium]|jgi:lipopolysaccharide export system permease protein|nr:LptF/LptG family permease [Kiritimatiellia bacterium]HOM58255.1 LptF/LptG family permease [Kiritimatiellia bacterium]HOR97466.1 LptF/LptG family permease [Kiritimatiellia bacterium]HPC48886.1 LptF/LptG family permease [Kiritimatiellia bacterium]HPW75150.1 LptF/LptG family permease [Kiritimatiellia bacterium]